MDHGLQTPRSSTKARKFGHSGCQRQSGGRPLPVSEPSAHHVVCWQMAVADKALDTTMLNNGVTLLKSAAEI